jgi:hypothetical protein
MWILSIYIFPVVNAAGLNHEKEECMRTIYRLNFDAGGWTERESIMQEIDGVMVDVGLKVLNDIRASQPGTIVAQSITYEITRRADDNSLSVVHTCDNADESDPVFNSYQESAAQEARDRYQQAYFKAPMDPQPQGLNP